MPSTYTGSQSPSLSSTSNSPNSISASLFSSLSPPLTPTTTETPPLTPINAYNPLLAPPQARTSPSLAPPSSLPSQISPNHSQPARPTAALPPPVHPANAPLQTTYTPYIPKARRLAAMSASPQARPGIGATANARAVQNASRAPDPPNVPVITSSSGGGVVMRHTINGAAGSIGPGASVKKADGGPSAALLDKVRALDGLPRLGELRTLDLRGNDIRVRSTPPSPVFPDGESDLDS